MIPNNIFEFINDINNVNGSIILLFYAVYWNLNDNVYKLMKKTDLLNDK